MSTQFPYEDLETGENIIPAHITQLFGPLNDLEEGQAFFRADTNTTTANAYQVDFSGSGTNKNAISAYKKGQLIVFQAASANTGPATLQVTGPSGALAAVGLAKTGGSPLQAGDVQAGQMVAVVYNDVGGGRFDMLGASMPSSLDASKIADGSVSNAQFEALAGVTGALQTQLDAKATHDVSSLTSGVLPLERGGTGQSGYTKGDMLAFGGTTLNKVSVGNPGQLLTADPTNFNGVSWKDPVHSGNAFLFGDGNDGDVNITSDTDLSDHMFYGTLNVAAGATLRTNGYKVYVQDTLILNGTISCNGGDATAASGTTAGSAGSGAGNSSNVAWGGIDGVQGALDAHHDQGSHSNSVFYAYGGAGGDGASGGGGNPTGGNQKVNDRFFRSLPPMLSGISDFRTNFSNDMIRFIRPALGGAAGAGDGSAAAGGSGGGGGGVVWIAAQTLYTDGGGTINANGGAGGAAGGTDAGGGGGGGGGVVYLLTSSNDNLYTINASGGAGGSGGGGAGTDGSSGDDGLVVFRGGL